MSLFPWGRRVPVCLPKQAYSIEAKWMDPILRTMASNQVVAGEDNLCFLDAGPLFFLSLAVSFL